MFSSVSTRSTVAMASTYKRVSDESSVASADPHTLVSLLFGALNRSLLAAAAAMQQGDIPQKGRHIGSAVRILEEGLMAPLNLTDGGDLAANLESLYSYCVVQLTVANLRNDAALIDEVVRLIEPIANSWKQINVQGPAYLQPV